ncbi:Probable arylamine n-acetyl transferase [Mycobacteroides abscessus]|nr:Probable arylamine n-acetyl transferase [Mycobacteroides abscessus]
MWNGDELQLDEYLAFIGFDGDRSPTLETLRRLQRGHVLNIKWENLDAVLHKNVALDIPAVQAKLLRSPRGGYCYEHVALFGAVLQRLGFDFFGIQGRVQMGATTIRPATHGMLVVRLAAEQWLCDVGFGTSPLAPIRLVDEAVVADESWTYQLRRGEVTPGADGWTFSEAAGDGSEPGWLSRHTFVLSRNTRSTTEPRAISLPQALIPLSAQGLSYSRSARTMHTSWITGNSTKSSPGWGERPGS